MTELRPCPGCSRHVVVGAATCPFCGTAITAPVARRATNARPISQLTRVAIFAAGAALLAPACGDDSSPGSSDAAVEPDVPVAHPYGAPPAGLATILV